MTSCELLSLGVTVYMTEEEDLWAEMERGDSQQGNSSEGVVYITVPSARAHSQVRAGSSGRQVCEEEFDSRKLKLYTQSSRLSSMRRLKVKMILLPSPIPGRVSC